MNYLHHNHTQKEYGKASPIKEKLFLFLKEFEQYVYKLMRGKNLTKEEGGIMHPSRNELWDSYTHEKSNEIRNKIVESYLNLVRQEAYKIKTPIGIEKQDIYQFGVLGLIDAVDKCDPDKIEKFEAYASIRIKGEIVDQLRQYAKHSQGVSRSTLKKIKEMEQIKNKLESIKKDKVNDREIMDYLNIDEKEYSKIQLKTVIHNGVPIEDFIDNPNEKKNFHIENAEEQILDEEMKKDIKKYLAILKEKERHVIESYYFQHKNISIIASELKVSQARISQLHHDGIKRLRQLMNVE